MSRGWRTMLILVTVTIPLLPLGIVPMVEAQKYEFKISMDTVPNHPRNMGIEIFVQRLIKRSGASWNQKFIIVPSFTKTSTSPRP